LESQPYGYRLKVRQRITREMDDARRRELRRWLQMAGDAQSRDA